MGEDWYKLNGRNERPVDRGIAIEQESFKIIENEVGEHGFDPYQWIIVRRVIHSTADFEYAQIMRFSPDAIDSARDAFHRRPIIYVDTNMIAAGLSKWRLGWYDLEVAVPSQSPEAHKEAVSQGITRSAAAFRLIAKRLSGSIAVIGNAPTALLELVRLIKGNIVRPALVVGVPVGFVQAAESKEMLTSCDSTPYIITEGRKGGSTIAVAIVHGLLECARLIDGHGHSVRQV